MLRTIFSTALMATMFMVLGPGSAHAQSQASTNVTATAVVLTALTLDKTADVVFGNLSGTTTGPVILDPQGSANSYVGVTAHVGKFTIGGGSSASVRVSWPTFILLSDGATHTIADTLAVSGYATDVQASSTDLTLSGGYATVTLSSGVYYLYVGGKFATLSNQAAGTYTNTANFTVDYN